MVREQERVYMDCQDSKRERKEGSVTVDIPGLLMADALLPLKTLSLFFVTCYNHAAYLEREKAKGVKN